MLALVCTQPHTLELRDLPEPLPGPDEVVVAVRAAGRPVTSRRRSSCWRTSRPTGSRACRWRMASPRSQRCATALRRRRRRCSCPAPSTICEGLDGLKEYVTRALAAFGLVQHYLTNPIVTLDGPDRAHVRANLLAIHRHRGEGPGEHFDGGCYYDLEAVRTRTGWRFRRMNLNLVWSLGAPPPGVAQRHRGVRSPVGGRLRRRPSPSCARSTTSGTRSWCGTSIGWATSCTATWGRRSRFASR